MHRIASMLSTMRTKQNLTLQTAKVLHRLLLLCSLYVTAFPLLTANATRITEREKWKVMQSSSTHISSFLVEVMGGIWSGPLQLGPAEMPLAERPLCSSRPPNVQGTHMGGEIMSYVEHTGRADGHFALGGVGVACQKKQGVRKWKYGLQGSDCGTSMCWWLMAATQSGVYKWSCTLELFHNQQKRSARKEVLFQSENFS